MGEPRPLDVLAEQISEAWAELLFARGEWTRSPNAESTQVAMYAEARLNRLLEQLFDSMSDKQKRAVDARPAWSLTGV